MSFDENNVEDLLESISLGTGRVVTIFTQSGGRSGNGFTGILADVNCRFVKLITRIPCGPQNPFGSEFRRGFERRISCCEGNPLGTVCIIPINKIVSFCFNEL